MTIQKKVLYAPTWRVDSETKVFPFHDFKSKELIDFLTREKITIYLRLHPNFERNNSIIDEVLKYDNKNKSIVVLDSKTLADINEILFDFDLLITDYSSIYTDYLLTHKPVMFLPYDKCKYKSDVGFSIDYDALTPGPKPNNFSSFQEELLKLLSNENYYESDRIRCNNIFNYRSNHPAKDCFQIIESIITKS